MKIASTLAAVATLAFLSGCSSSSDSGAADSEAPAQYRAKFETSKGDFVVEVTREWASLGADRFYTLVRTGFFDDARFFRVLPGFVVQFGLKGDPAVDAKWESAVLQDDPPGRSNAFGTITFASRGPNSRTSQVFISVGENSRLDSMGFTPFGRVIEGMKIVMDLYSGYGEGVPNGTGPNQALIRSQGNKYLTENFPRLDYVKKASIQ